MIFVTVGTQLPFDRMIEAVDIWAERNPSEPVVAQIGPGTFRPRHCQYVDFLSPAEIEACHERCNWVVAHAGIGSVLTARAHRRPIIVMPRQQGLREHRSDHQMATVRHLSCMPGVSVAMTADELHSYITRRHALVPGNDLQKFAAESLLSKLGDWIRQQGAAGPN